MVSAGRGQEMKVSLTWRALDWIAGNAWSGGQSFLHEADYGFTSTTLRPECRNSRCSKSIAVYDPLPNRIPA